MLSNKYKDDRNLIDMVTYSNNEKVMKDGYYEVCICDKDNVCNDGVYVTSNNNVEGSKFFPIFGKMIGGIMTELVTDIVLNYKDDIDIVVDNERKDNVNITSYHFSNPCYVSAYQIYPKEMAEVLRDLDDNYNVEEYKTKILSQINEATRYYRLLTKEDEKYIEEFISKHKTKNYTRI